MRPTTQRFLQARHVERTRRRQRRLTWRMAAPRIHVEPFTKGLLVGLAFCIPAWALTAALIIIETRP